MFPQGPAARTTPTPGLFSFRRPAAPAPAAPAAAKPVAVTPTAPAQKKPPAFEETDRFIDLKVRLHEKLLEIMNLSALDKLERGEIGRQVDSLVQELLVEDEVPLSAQERAHLVSDIIDELLGLGPLEPLLKDPTVNDILVNTHSQCFVERAGTLELTKVKFKDEKHLRRIIDKIVTGVGRRVDESCPTVDARLPDGSRVNAVIPPVAVDGSLLSIRKFSKQPLTIDRLIEYGAMTEQIAEVLRGIVRIRLNVLISGGTGTGKTTMLNALSSFIDGRERIVTIEDAAELQLQQIHVVRLETRPANIEGKGEIAQRELLKNSLRMRPDRIIVGETRGGEAFDMLQAMNTGHDGSMTTVHANTPRDALGRLEQMIGMAGLDLPARSIRQQISSAINVVLQIRRFSDGRRRMVSLSELTGMEGDVISMQEIFAFRQTGVTADGTVEGHFVATGVRPTFFDRFASNGIHLPDDLLAANRRL